MSKAESLTATSPVADRTPMIVGFGGTTREPSTSELALRCCLQAAEIAGARVVLIPAAELEFTLYDPDAPQGTAATQFLDVVRQADGLIIATPGYHGGVSGLVKNALDYLEELREDQRPYLHGRGVGCISCAYGRQATTTTLVSLRSTVHALRGWPTPLGVALNSAEHPFAVDGEPGDPRVADQLRVLGEQVVGLAFALRRMP